MAALSEKTLWPIIGIFIFGILAGLYYDDRRRMIDEGTAESTDQQASAQQSGKSSGSPTESSSSKTKSVSGYGSQPVKATSMDINEYLAKIKDERDRELKSNAADHQGFNGNIDEYLSRAKSTMQASSKNNEYLAKNSNTQVQQNSPNGTYHGGIDGYLAKYGEGSQTQLNKGSGKSFNKKEHMGFHGSYEDYAKKYN